MIFELTAFWVTIAHEGGRRCVNCAVCIVGLLVNREKIVFIASLERCLYYPWSEAVEPLHNNISQWGLVHPCALERRRGNLGNSLTTWESHYSILCEGDLTIAVHDACSTKCCHSCIRRYDIVFTCIFSYHAQHHLDPRLNAEQAHAHKSQTNHQSSIHQSSIKRYHILTINPPLSIDHLYCWSHLKHENTIIKTHLCPHPPYSAWVSHRNMSTIAE